MTNLTSARNRRTSVLRCWRFVSATLFATTFAMCTLPTGCAASDEYAQAPSQPSEQAQPVVRSLDPGVENTIRACVKEGVSRLKWHSYELNFEVEATPKGVVQDVETKGKRLDDEALETCMIQALKAMPVRDLLKPDDSLQDELAPATSQSISPPTRSLIGHAEVLPQVIRLAPIVFTGSGVTIVVTVVVVVAVVAVAAVAIEDLSKECEDQWEDARDYCEKILRSRNPSRRLTGGYKNIDDCARGHVEEPCRGNPVDWGKQGRPGTRY